MAGNQRIHQYVPLWGVWHRLADALSIGIAMAIALYASRAEPRERYVLAAVAAILIHGMLAELSGMYRSWRGVSAHREMVGSLFCWTSTLGALLVLGFAARYTSDFSRSTMAMWFAVASLLLVASRIFTRGLQRTLRSWGYGTRTFAIVGINEIGFQLAKNIEDSPELGLTFVGFFDDRPEQRSPDIPGKLGRRIGTIQDLLAQTRSGAIDRVYITFPMRAEDRIRGVLAQLSDTTVSTYLVPDFFVFQILHSRWTDILGVPAVSVFESPLYGIDGLSKRLSDVILGGVFLLAAAIPMVFIAVAVKLTSPGPVFFRQRRYGLDGREIRVWKFRTMTVCEEGTHAVQAKRNDPRVTRLGAFLRKTSLDELPQLFNVLQGTMSLVGPRPHPNALNEEFRAQIDGYMLRHKVKPGITGLAQVNGWRGETETPEKMRKRIEFDHRYIREWSLWLDVKILLKTVLVVLLRTNAY